MASSTYYWNLTRDVAGRMFTDGNAQQYFINAMRQESGGFDPDVCECRRDSPAGAKGIAQIVPAFHPGVDPCDPPKALEYAAMWLAELRRSFGSWRAAYAAYNAGPGTVAALRQRYGESWEDHLPDETRQYLRTIFTEPPMPVRDIPAPGPITQGFGENPNNGVYGPEGHTGIDIGCPEGTAVRAARAGRVVYADWMYHPQFPGDPTRGYGKLVIVQAGPEEHYYAHLSALTASKGVTVKRGDVLAQSGSTGMATGPHLHLEKRVGGRIVDPSDLLAPPAEPGPQTPPVVARVAATDGLRIRSGPGTQYAAVGLLEYGAEIAVVERDQWCELSGYPGSYVAGWWLDFAPLMPPKPSPDSEALRASAVRAWTRLRDKAAYVHEAADVTHQMVRDAEQKDIDEAAAALRALGVN